MSLPSPAMCYIEIQMKLTGARILLHAVHFKGKIASLEVTVFILALLSITTPYHLTTGSK